MKFMALLSAAMLTVMTVALTSAPSLGAGAAGRGAPGGGAPGGGAPRGGRGPGGGGGGMPAIETAKAIRDLEKPSTPTKPVDPDGFIQRWLILDPIADPVNVQAGTPQAATQIGFQAIVKTEHFPNELTITPRDGDKVTTSAGELTWNAIDTKEFKLNLMHYGTMVNKRTENIFFWVVTYVVSPDEVQGARLAIGSNDASIWWVNGQEVTGIYGDRPAQIDEGVSKRLTLKKGVNVVRGAVHNRAGQTDFLARFLDKDDRPITNLTVDLQAAAK